MAKEDVNIKVSANVAEAIQLWKAMEKGPEGMANALSDMGQKGKKAGKDIGDSAFDLVGKWTSVAAAVGLVTKALHDMEQNAQAAADRVFGALDSAGKLAQVASTPGEYQKLLAEGRSLVQRGVFAPDQQGAANELVFAMTSAGFTDRDRQFIAGLGESRLVAPGELTEFGKGLAKIRDIFGAKEAGSISDIGAKIIAGAKVTQASASEFSAATTRFGSGAVALGMSDEEALAGVATIEKGSGNIDVASTRYAALLAQIDKKKLWRGSQAASIDAIEAELRAGKDIRAVLGDNQEAIGGYRAFMADRAGYDRTLQELRTAPRRDVIGVQSKLLETDPQTRAALRRAEEEGAEASIYEQQDAERENLFDAYRAALRTRNRQKYGGIVGGFLNTVDAIGYGAIDVMQMEDEEFRSIPA
jgi:hypothetical protein